MGSILQWVYVHCAISAKFGVMVFKASMLYCMGVGLICHGYICILLYVRRMGCNCVELTYSRFWGVSICNGYMCIVLYI